MQYFQGTNIFIFFVRRIAVIIIIWQKLTHTYHAFFVQPHQQNNINTLNSACRFFIENHNFHMVRVDFILHSSLCALICILINTIISYIFKTVPGKQFVFMRCTCYGSIILSYKTNININFVNKLPDIYALLL